MAYVSHDDYTRFADAIVKDFESDRQPMGARIVKLAKEHDFNEEQARRMVERVNTMAHLKLFEKKGSDDQYITFDTVDPDDVLAAVGMKPAKTASVRSLPPAVGVFDLPDEHFRRVPIEQLGIATLQELESYQEKQASHEAPYTVRTANQGISLLKKAAEELRIRSLSADMAVEDQLEKIAHSVDRMSSQDRAEFVNDVFAVQGAPVAAEMITKLARFCRADLGSVVLEADHLVWEKRAEVEGMKTAAALLADALEAAQSLDYLRRKFDGIL